MNICYIFSASDISDYSVVNKIFDRDDLVICVDGGYRHTRRLGVYPNILVGDFDSIDEMPEFKNKIVLSPEKDDTDTHYAVRLGLQNGFKRFVIYGALGGRLDHTLANLQTAMFVAKSGGQATLVDGNDIVTVITNSKIKVPKTKGYSLSLFSLSDICTNVTIKGAKYPLDDATLTGTVPIGVSNEFVEDFCEISVGSGFLAVIKSKL